VNRDIHATDPSNIKSFLFSIPMMASNLIDISIGEFTRKASSGGITEYISQLLRSEASV
jgi:hypothetical protein